MIVLIGIPVILLLICALASHSVDKDDYKYYPVVFKRLNKEGWINSEYPYYQVKSNKNPGVVYFELERDIKLAEGIYLFEGFFTYINPYSCYWYFKYRNWFKKNVL